MHWCLDSLVDNLKGEVFQLPRKLSSILNSHFFFSFILLLNSFFLLWKFFYLLKLPLAVCQLGEKCWKWTCLWYAQRKCWFEWKKKIYIKRKMIFHFEIYLNYFKLAQRGIIHTLPYIEKSKFTTFTIFFISHFL